MTRDIAPAGSPASGAVDEAFSEVRVSFDRFCLAAGIEALGTMMEAMLRRPAGRATVAARRASCGHPSGAAPGAMQEFR
jgi:putative transposase